MTRIIVTGASGFIGHHLVAKLADSGHDVLCLGRSNSSLQRIKANVQKHVTDYSISNLSDIMNGYNIIVHLAGRRLSHADDKDFTSPFITQAASMLDNLLRAAKLNNIKRIVTASSIGVYSSANNAPYSEDQLPKPATPYGVMKLFCEQAVDFWCQNNDASAAHIRLAQCYGLGEKESGVLMRFIAQAKAGETLHVASDGSFPIDEIYVKDAINAFQNLIETNKTGAFNIGAGRGYSILDIAKVANTVFNNNKSNNIVVETKKAANNRQTEKHMNIAKAKQLLKWQPEYSLLDSFEHMHNNIQNNK